MVELLFHYMIKSFFVKSLPTNKLTVSFFSDNYIFLFQSLWHGNYPITIWKEQPPVIISASMKEVWSQWTRLTIGYAWITVLILKVKLHCTVHNIRTIEVHSNWWWRQTRNSVSNHDQYQWERAYTINMQVYTSTMFFTQLLFCLTE